MQINEIFVVFDPTRKEQLALDRAVNAARDLKAAIRLFACIYADVPRASRAQEIKQRVAAQKQQLQEQVADIEAESITVFVEVEWEENWYDAVIRAVLRHGSDVLFKTTHKHSATQRYLGKTSDWALIRECPCPVLLVKESANWEHRKALAAIDIQADDELHQRLNHSIVQFTKDLLLPFDTEVHFINAYEDSMSFPDRSKLMQYCDTDTKYIHIDMGSPGDAILERAKSLDATVVVIGSTGRSGISGLVRGNTAEKILDELHCDLLLIP